MNRMSIFKNFVTRTVGQAAGSKVSSEICELAVAKATVTNSSIPSSNVLILRSMYVPGQPVMYRVAYPVSTNKENRKWEVADVTENDLSPSIRLIDLNTGDF